MATTNLTVARLRELFNYDKKTGALTWAINRGTAKAGQSAGMVGNRGHIKVKAHGKFYQGHRIIWALVTGAWPTEDIDHRDCDRANNRWDNLREATKAVNAQNQRVPRKDNTSGFLGVYVLRAKPGWFFARIRVAGKLISLGAWGDGESAHAAYVQAKRRLHTGCTL